MTDHPVRSRHLTMRVVAPQSLRLATAAGLLCLALALSGCAERKRPTLPWPAASIVHPRVPVILLAETNLADEEVPAELRLELPAPPANFPPASYVRPPRTRAVASQPAAVEPSKPQLPIAAPQLSAEESSSAQQETTASL